MEHCDKCQYSKRAGTGYSGRYCNGDCLCHKHTDTWEDEFDSVFRNPREHFPKNFEYVKDFIRNLITRRDEELKKRIKSVGAGLSANEKDNTEYEKGYYGAMKDVISIINNQSE